MVKLTVNKVKELLEKLDCSILKKPEKNKGKRGKNLENTLGISNGTSLTDLEDGEIKSYKIGQTIAVTQLLHYKLLQIRTKGSKNKKTNSYPKLIYNGCELKDKYMAFYICASYGKELFG